MIKLCEPLVDDIIGFVDRVSFSTECTDERLTQNAMYSKYVCDTMVNNNLLKDLTGKFFCALNFPGSWGMVLCSSIHAIH